MSNIAKGLVGLAVFVRALLPSYAHAQLASDPCNATPVPEIQLGTVDVIAHSNQRQRGWQREGRDIDISLRSAKIPDTGKLRAFVCFRWQVSSENSGEIKPYRRFVQSASTGGLITVESPQQLKIVATMPTDLPDTPVSPQDPQPEHVIGVYARNNAFPIADLRVLLFDENGTLKFDALSAFGVLGYDEYCNTPLADTSTDSGVGVLGEHKNWQPVGGQFEFSVKTTKTDSQQCDGESLLSMEAGERRPGSRSMRVGRPTFWTNNRRASRSPPRSGQSRTSRHGSYGGQAARMLLVLSRA